MRVHWAYALALVPIAAAGLWLSVSRGGVRPSPPARTKQPVSDITFLIASDTHVGFRDDVPIGVPPEKMSFGAATAFINQEMNAMATRSFPKALGGAIGAPAALLLAGDLTEQGKPAEWAEFESTFGLHGGDGQLNFPVYEGAGNHDKWSGTYVEDGIRKRHGSPYYAVDLQDLHVVCLGEAPGDRELAWLTTDLGKLGPEKGLIVFFHFPVTGPSSTGNWFFDGGYRERLAKALEGHEVLGIFNGHSHLSGMARWEGHDAYFTGSPKHAAHAFLVARVTGQSMKVASYNYDRRAFWWWHEKSVFGGTAPERRCMSAANGLIGAADRGNFSHSDCAN
jgi:hypothetical protein